MQLKGIADVRKSEFQRSAKLRIRKNSLAKFIERTSYAILIAIVLLQFSTPANAFCLWNCPTVAPTGKEVRSSAQISADPLFIDAAQGAQAANNYFAFIPLTQPVEKSGYVRVAFSFVGRIDPKNPNLIIYDDADQTSQDMFERSILDWAKRLFVSEKRTYLVTLTARSASTQETFWVQPIISFQYDDEFKAIKVTDKFSFNGSSVFYRKANEEIQVTLDVVHTTKASVDVDFIKSIFDTAGQLAGLLGGDVFSIANIMSNASYRVTLGQLMEKIREFESSKALSRTVTLKYEVGRWIGYQYHFLAPEVNYTPFKLRVGLEFKKSLLDDGVEPQADGTQALKSEVLAWPVRPKDANSNRTLADYIDTEGESKGVDDIINAADKDLNDACIKLRESLRKIFDDRDIALASLAYFQHYKGKLGTRRAPDCFERQQKGYFASYRIELPINFRDDSVPGALRQLKPLNKYVDDYMVALAALLRFGEADRDKLQSSIKVVTNQARIGEDERAVRVDDKTQNFIKGDPRKIQPTDLVNYLLRETFEFAGCYHAAIYSDATDPNVAGMIFGSKDKLYEVIVRFDQTPPTNITPSAPSGLKVDEIVFRQLSAEGLEKYALAWGKKPCFGNWAPWRIG